MKKRFLASLLIVCMLLVMLPVTVAAEEAVAKIAGTEVTVTNLDDAFSAEKNPGCNSVILLKDYEGDVDVESGAYSFYLNGHTMTGTFKLSGGIVNFNGSLAGTTEAGAVSKIQNTGLGGKYPIYCHNGNFNIGGGDIQICATGENGTAIYSDGSKLNINKDITVTGNVETGVYGIISITAGTFDGSLIRGENSSLEVVGGKFSKDPSACMPDGYKSTLTDGYYEVSVGDVSLNNLETDSDGSYIISEPHDVVVFRTLLNTAEDKNILSGKVFKQTANIDMSDITLAPAGNDSKRFMGTYDGQNYTISNVTIAGGNDTYVAFFGNISGATIKNVTLKNVTVTGGSYTAGLVGFTRNSIIENCKIIGEIDISGTSHVGGIHAGGVVSITECAVKGTGTISGDIDVGAISGLISEGSTIVSGNSVEGITVSGDGLVGGLIGRAIVGSSGLEVSGNAMVDVSVISTADSYDQNGLAVGCTQAANGSITYKTNTFTDSTLTVDGAASDIVYCNTNFDGTDYSEKVEIVPSVAKIGNTEYATLQAAIDAADGKPVVILSNIELAEGVTVPAGKTVTIDLNGKNISYNSAVQGEDMITNKGNLTIIDSSEPESGKITYVNTDTTANNVTVSTISCEPGSVLNIKSGTVENKTVQTGTIYAYAIDILTNGNLGDITVNISGGTVYSDYMAIRQFNNGDACKNTLNVSGDCYIYGAKRAIQVHFENNAAYTDISSGKIEGGGYSLCLLTTSENISVTGGNFVGSVWYSGDAGIVSGGTFSSEDVLYYLAEGYKLTEAINGQYGVIANDDTLVEVRFNVRPTNAEISISGGTVIDNGDGTYTLIEGKDYYYKVSYDGTSEGAEFTAEAGLVISVDVSGPAQPDNDVVIMPSVSDDTIRLEDIKDTSAFDSALGVYTMQILSGTGSFVDVSKSDWFYSDVTALISKGVINGYPDGSFRPQGVVTWGEALKLVMKAVGYGDIAAINGHWASGYMETALANLLISGEVDLDAAITREEVANLTAQALKLAPAGIEYPFDDAAPEAAVALYAAGIINGSADNGQLLFRAESTITRAEMAAVIWRVYCAR